MLQRTPLRAARALSQRTFTTSALRATPTTSHGTDNPVLANDPNPKTANSPASSTNELATSSEGAFDKVLQEGLAEGEQRRVMQAPNRDAVWSRSQKPRAEAMLGPRFEQTIMEDQPRPMAAINLIHQQPVRWTHSRTVSCDGGGGPLGHPRIFINVDKPQICWCTYCGVPYAHEHHRKHLESLPTTSYPLGPNSDPAALPAQDVANRLGKTGSTEPLQTNTGLPLEQR